MDKILDPETASSTDEAVVDKSTDTKKVKEMMEERAKNFGDKVVELLADRIPREKLNE